MGEIVQTIQWLALQMGCRIWFEWIDSKSNPSDGLSRDGLDDAWTKAQGWDIAEILGPDLIASKNALREIVHQTLDL